MNRRDFLALSAASFATPAWAATAEGGPSRLVVVMLRGAVDGLNVVVPYGDQAYYDMRPSIAIAKPGGEDGALALDGHFGLHPALAGLMPLWQAKQLAFIHASGSPDPTRSHFDAQLFIENGTPGKRTTDDGWMNRLLAALPGARGPTDALAVGPILPFIPRRGGWPPPTCRSAPRLRKRWRSIGPRSQAPSTSSMPATTLNRSPIARAAPRAPSSPPIWATTSNAWPMPAHRRPIPIRRSPIGSRG